jgi:hypothetical protein
MHDVGWLKQSLLEAREETRRLPEWVRQLISAREAYYGPRDSRGMTADAGATKAAERAKTSEAGNPMSDS